ncbi:MAG: N-6 DNA methylase [Bacteroidales bacterium]|nr:N-6 DNA methylase [Bacteroidales bacterium]
MEKEQNQPKEGYIIDYISGTQVKASPEEVEATQVFSKILVEDYGYPKEYIQTRPQFHVKVRPSDTKKEYPVDIAVFGDSERTDDSIYLIVECKKKNRKDGRTQLENYLTLSKANIGVWFNGEERFYLLKQNTDDGRVLFKEIPNIPKFGERLEDIGKFKRKDLKPTHNLKTVFNAIRNYLAGNATGTTMDQVIAQQIINIIFCKIYDERFTKMDDEVTFRVGINENSETVSDRIKKLFAKVKSKYNEVIEIADEIKLDDTSIKYVVGELQSYCLIDTERDVVADAFEVFIQYALKGGQGQFFTPRNVVKLMVELVKPQPNEIVIDPACGSGGFLVESMRYMWRILEEQALDYGWNEIALEEEKKSCAIKYIKGIEKDSFLAKVTKAYMAILGDGKGGIFCEDALLKPSEWKIATQQSIGLGHFDVLLANPPFGKDIKVTGEDKLKQYELAYKWKTEDGKFIKTNILKKEEAIQIIYIERCLSLLKEGGRMGLIIPETYFHAPSTKYILQFLLNGNNVMWLVDLPHNTFRPHNNAKCVIIVLQKGQPQQEVINMAVAEQMGHDHQGKEMFRWNNETKKIDTTNLWDDIPLILSEINNKQLSKYCFSVDNSIVENKGVYVPRYYWQNKMQEIRKQAEKDNQTLVSINKLIQNKVITFLDGHGSPEAETKGKGEIPYIRVKDIVNWEVYKDPTSRIPIETYIEKKGSKKEIKVHDILYVRRGSYRIGSVAMVSPFDTEALYTREILILRVNENNEYGITPFYLLYLLSHKLTQMQAENKILIETTLPNIADRWKELELPIDNDKERIKQISSRIETVIENKWKAAEEINKLCKELGNLTT